MCDEESARNRTPYQIRTMGEQGTHRAAGALFSIRCATRLDDLNAALTTVRIPPGSRTAC